MKKRHISQLNQDVSVLGLGTMIFAPKKKELCFNVLDEFLQAGGNLIDTAEIYGDPEEYGYSEQTIGMWLSETKNRDKIILISKGCIPGTCKPIQPQGAEISPKGIQRSIEGSLKRLQTNYLDIWLLHRDDPSQPVGPLVETLNEEIEKGNIRAYGGSNWSVERIKEANAYANANGLIGMAVSSPHFSLAEAKEPYWPDTVVTRAEDVEWYVQNQFPLIAWSSLGRGFFAKGSPDYTDDKDLMRVFYSDANFERKRRAEELAKEKKAKSIEIALAYVINQEFPAIALVGPVNKAEVDSCVVGAGIELSEREKKWLNLEIENQ